MKQKCLYDGDVYVGVMTLMNQCSASVMKNIIVIEMIVIVMVVIVIVMVVIVIVMVVIVMVMVVLH